MSLNISGATAQIKAAAQRGAMSAAEELRGYAVAKAPRLTGDLQDTADTKPADGPDPGASVVFPMIYATIQHERTDFNHPRGGQAKFLEDAAQENAARLAQTVADHIKGHM